MGSTKTVVFADLTGSTGVFESLGNSKATLAIMRLTQWIGEVCVAHEGRVVKMLGDGVLAVFPAGENAISAVVELQRNHQRRIENWPEKLRMRLKVGVASGDLVEVEGDCYGDAVNVASRLSDLSGADQIWATDSVVNQLANHIEDTRYRDLGPINIRGRTEPANVYRIEWQEEVHEESLTMPATLEMMGLAKGNVEPTTTGRHIELSWLDVSAVFPATQLPIFLGRVDSQFVVNDPRVSRKHAKIEWRNGAFVIVDMSSYGTWIKFTGSNNEVALRREECVLHDSGDIALGSPFSDFTVPTVAFKLAQGKVTLEKRGGIQF